MATWAYPPLDPDQLRDAREASLAREVRWYLQTLQQSFASLRRSLQDCANLLAPTQHGSTLAMSSPRSECVKGYLTRVGTAIVKGDINLRLNSLPPPKGSSLNKLAISTEPTAVELSLQQLVIVRRLINDSLDVVDVSTWTGDPTDAHFISGQLRLLHDNLVEARLSLKGEENRRPWHEESANPKCFNPALPPNLSFHLSIHEAALVLCLRTLEPATQTQGSFSELLRDSIFGHKQPQHDESGIEFTYAGSQVKVVEKVTVESQDPNLMSAMAKLTALENEVSRWRIALGELMGDRDS